MAAPVASSSSTCCPAPSGGGAPAAAAPSGGCCAKGKADEPAAAAAAAASCCASTVAAPAPAPGGCCGKGKAEAEAEPVAAAACCAAAPASSSGGCCDKKGTAAVAAAPLESSDGASVRAAVASYYGVELQGTGDLKSTACCTGGETTAAVRALLRNVHEDVIARFYGCGSPVPPAVGGMTTLDLGCGTGRDTYVLAQLVGPTGTAIGLDMTPEQLAVARRTEAWHAARFGFSAPNTRFLDGAIEDLRAAGVADGSVDVAVSNCVLNLLADKAAGFREIARVLKPGGELYFSDVYADRRMPPALRADRVLWGECLSGALYTGDATRLLRDAGFGAVWTVTRRVMDVSDAAIAAATRGITFTSVTLRAIKVAPVDDAPEDYGQTATYNGSIDGAPHAFVAGAGAVFITDVPTPVDGNTAAALAASRYAPAFRITPRGDHRGAFVCTPAPYFVGSSGGGGSAAGGGGCC